MNECWFCWPAVFVFWGEVWDEGLAGMDGSWMRASGGCHYWLEELDPSWSTCSNPCHTRDKAGEKT